MKPKANDTAFGIWSHRRLAFGSAVLASISLLFACHEPQREENQRLPKAENCVDDLMATRIGKCACEEAYPLRGQKHAALSLPEFLKLCEPSDFVAMCEDGSADFWGSESGADLCDEGSGIAAYLRVPDA